MRIGGRRIEAHHWALAATAALVYAFMLAPIVIVAIGSLESEHSYYIRIPPRTISLAAYWSIPAKYVTALLVSLGLAAAAALISTLLGTMAALALVRGRVRARPALEAYFRVPLQIPGVVVGVAFLIFYNRLAQASGLDLLGTFPGVLTAHVFITLPYAVSSVAVVLARMNPHIEEAAHTLGARPWSIFRRVTLPIIKPGVFTGFFYGFVISFGDVPLTVFIAGGKTATTLPVEIFHTLQFDFDPSVLAVSVVVVLVCTAMILLVQRLVGLDLVLPSGRK